MPKKSVSEPVFDETRNRWRVTLPPSVTKDKRVRSWHATRDVARAYINGITTPTTPAAAIPPKLAMLADEARDILAPFNLDLVQGARDLAAALKVLGGVGTVVEAAQAFRASHDARAASKPLSEAVALYLDSRKDLREATLRGYRYTLETVLAPLASKPMADIATADLETVLAPMADSSRALHKRTMNALWKWAGHPNRGWCPMDAVRGLEAPRVSNDADITVLSPAEVRALLTAAEAESPGAAASYALAVFGGIRMLELTKLRWADIGADSVEIGKAVAKKHARRLVPICPTLRSWLDACRGDADHIIPPNWTEVSKCVRRRAGWAVESRLLTDPPKPTRGPWPANAPRHTCASVQVAIGTPLEDLTFKFGHSGGHDVLKGHYVGRMTKKTALEILAIGPSGSKVKLLASA